jgi:AraC-like DNA-binding protein
MPENYYRQYLPSAELSGFIECYWVLRSAQQELHDCQRLIPGGRVEMIFNFGDPFHWLIDGHAPVTPPPQGQLAVDLQIMGQRDRIFFTRATGSTDLLGIRFKPGGIRAFTRIPVSEFLNSMVPADLVLGNHTHVWEALLSEEKDDLSRILTLNRLLRNVRQDPPAEWAVLQAALGLIRGNTEEPSTLALCQQSGWYYKKMERAFLQSIGYTPKYFHRVVRFNKAVRLMNDRRDESLTGIAYSCGYYDQSHFIRDFHRFAGTSPGRFTSEENAIAELLIRYQPV